MKTTIKKTSKKDFADEMLDCVGDIFDVEHSLEVAGTSDKERICELAKKVSQTFLDVWWVRDNRHGKGLVEFAYIDFAEGAVALVLNELGPSGYMDIPTDLSREVLSHLQGGLTPSNDEALRKCKNGIEEMADFADQSALESRICGMVETVILDYASEFPSVDNRWLFAKVGVMSTLAILAQFRPDLLTESGVEYYGQNKVLLHD